MQFILKEPVFKFRELKSIKSLNNDFHFKELKKNGFTVLKGFCKNPEDAVNELENHWNNKKAWQDEVKSDTRLFGIDKKIKFFKSFFLKNQYLLNFFKKYISPNKISSFIMANKVIPKKNNIGSGGNWHRDDKNGRQLKFILYLTDVKKNNGGFNYIKYTHKPINRILYSYKLGWNLNKYRFVQEEVDRLPNKYQIVDVIGKAGDLIIVDTSGIHKGSPIKSGKRIALTQYLWDSDEIPDSFKKQLI